MKQLTQLSATLQITDRHINGQCAILRLAEFTEPLPDNDIFALLILEGIQTISSQIIILNVFS